MPSRAVLAALSVMAVALPAAVSAQSTGENKIIALRGVPVAAADIAAAVGDCVERSGDRRALTGLGYTKVSADFDRDQMVPYRRNGRGAALILPAVDTPLRCWVIAIPASDKDAVIAAIDARFGASSRRADKVGEWQAAGHGIVLDWAAEPGKPPVARIEVYKFPQESK